MSQTDPFGPQLPPDRPGPPRRQKPSPFHPIRIALMGLPLVSLAMAALLVLIGTFLLPHLKATFAELGANVPLPTRILLSLPKSLYWATGAAVLLVMTVAKVVIRNEKIRFAIHAAVVVVLGVCVVLHIVGLYLPLVTLVEQAARP